MVCAIWEVDGAEGFDLSDGGRWVDHAEVADCRYPGGHVVARDHLLRRHGERDGAKVDAHHPVHQRHERYEPWPLDG